MHSQVTKPRDGTEKEFKLGTPCKANKNYLLLTKLSCIVPTVIEEKFVFRGDVLRGAEVNFSIMRISYQVLLFPVPTAITTVKSPSEVMTGGGGRGEKDGRGGESKKKEEKKCKRKIEKKKGKERKGEGEGKDSY